LSESKNQITKHLTSSRRFKIVISGWFSVVVMCGVVCGVGGGFVVVVLLSVAVVWWCGLRVGVIEDL
jgi:hypothetical protein